MRTLSTITMAMLCVMLVAVCTNADTHIAEKEILLIETERLKETVKQDSVREEEVLIEALGKFEEKVKKVQTREDLEELAISLSQFEQCIIGIVAYNSEDYQEAREIFISLDEYDRNLEVDSERWFDAIYGDIYLFLGVMYSQGRGGEKNYKKALQFYERAVNEGSTGAMNNLATMYNRGEGVEKNYRKAGRLFLLAAQQGDGLGQYNFGNIMYDEHIYEEAYYWYNLAKKKEEDFGGIPDTTVLTTIKVRLEEIEGRLDHKKINELHALTGDDWKPRQFVASGSGFFISKEYILTNAHVVCSNYPASPCEPYDELGTTYYLNKEGERVTYYRLEVKETDIDVDLALLEVVSARKDSNWAKIRSASAESGSTSALQIGEDIAVFGYPLAEKLSYEGNFTIGNVSATTGRPTDVTPSDFFQFTAPIQPGNSGGPVLDAAGNVVGVAANLERVPDQNLWMNIAQNINFAVSLKAIKNFLKEAGIEPYASSKSSTSSQEQWDDWERRQAVLVSMKKFQLDMKSGRFSSGSYFSSRDTIKAWTEVAEIAEKFTVPILCFTYKE